eukprot:CAMPEP_0115011996 /NCGR_PEP_ID=MMETSP0216-20121206/24423_1 /TAXON_ID=223996 /ORGANISM="Protocruzia adherens, Strain Boccale" /LENGTH=569 /DNA_ID=CAMNT_0002380867 /DNA_START=166 /DNA_END=1875 /DNA_ORIENTATION=+
MLQEVIKGIKEESTLKFGIQKFQSNRRRAVLNIESVKSLVEKDDFDEEKVEDLPDLPSSQQKYDWSVPAKQLDIPSGYKAAEVWKYVSGRLRVIALEPPTKCLIVEIRGKDKAIASVGSISITREDLRHLIIHKSMYVKPTPDAKLACKKRVDHMDLVLLRYQKWKFFKSGLRASESANKFLNRKATYVLESDDDESEEFRFAVQNQTQVYSKNLCISLSYKALKYCFFFENEESFSKWFNFLEVLLPVIPIGNVLHSTQRFHRFPFYYADLAQGMEESYLTEFHEWRVEMIKWQMNINRIDTLYIDIRINLTRGNPQTKDIVMSIATSGQLEKEMKYRMRELKDYSQTVQKSVYMVLRNLLLRTKFKTFEEEYKNNGILVAVKEPEVETVRNVLPLETVRRGTVSATFQSGSEDTNPFKMGNLLRKAFAMKMSHLSKVPRYISQVNQYDRYQHRKFLKTLSVKRESKKTKKKFDLLDEVAELIFTQRMELESRLLILRDDNQRKLKEQGKVVEKIAHNALELMAKQMLRGKQSDAGQDSEEEEQEKIISRNLVEEEARKRDNCECMIF